MQNEQNSNSTAIKAKGAKIEFYHIAYLMHLYSPVLEMLESKCPCTQIVYTLALKYSLCRYFGAKVYTSWAHGPLGEVQGQYTEAASFALPKPSKGMPKESERSNIEASMMTNTLFWVFLIIMTIV